MLSFLKQGVPDKQPPRIIPQLANVKRTLEENHERIVKFWHGMNWSVKGEHILVGLLTQLSSHAVTPLDIYSSVRDTLLSFVMSRGFVTQYSYGRVQPKSHFYGHECDEVLVEQPFDDAFHQIIGKHYTEWETLRIITHPFTSFDYQLANGKLRKSGEKGLCVIKMDLALLYTQYVLWRRDTFRSKYEDGTNKAITNFVHTYPIVSLLKSHNERVWFNRLFHLAAGRPVSDIREDTRLRLIDPYLYINDIQYKLIELLERSRANFHEWCCWLPGIFTKNLKAHLIQDNILETQQIRLAWLLGFKSAISFLLQTELTANTGSNKQSKSELIREHRRSINNSLYVTIKGLDGNKLRNDIEKNIIDIAEMI